MGAVTLGERLFYAHLEEHLHVLNERQYEVIVARYGMFGTLPKTLKTLAGEQGCSPERVRQIEKEATAKMRASYWKKEPTCK